MDDVMLTETELAKRWKLTTRTLQLWRRAGKGPKFINISDSEKKAKIRYLISDVVRYENRESSHES